MTTRREAAAVGEPDHEAGGLGLGLFIAKTLLERSGATLDLANRPAPEKGAIVRISWPRGRMDMDREGDHSTLDTMVDGPTWRTAVRSL